MPIEDKLILILTLLNIPLFFLIGKLIFNDWASFWEAVIFWFKPDIWSLLDGSYFEDCWAELRLLFFALACAATLFTEYALLQQLFFS